MTLPRNLTLAFSAAALAATPVAAQGADAQRTGAAVEASEELGGDGGIFGGALLGSGWVIPAIAVMAVILAFTVSSDDPVSP